MQHRYYLENSASTYCDYFALTLMGPDGNAFRAYNSDGEYLDDHYFQGGLDLQAKVDNVVVAGLGSDSSNNQIQAVDRLFAFSANGDGGPFCGNMRSKGDSYDDWSSVAPPKFDVTMDNWFLCGEDGADGTCPASPSSICNYVGNHDGDWKIEGGDPDSDHNCQFKSRFPWKF